MELKLKTRIGYYLGGAVTVSIYCLAILLLTFIMFLFSNKATQIYPEAYIYFFILITIFTVVTTIVSSIFWGLTVKVTEFPEYILVTQGTWPLRRTKKIYYNLIDNVDFERSFLDKYFGIYTLRVHFQREKGDNKIFEIHDRTVIGFRKGFSTPSFYWAGLNKEDLRKLISYFERKTNKQFLLDGPVA